MNIFSINLVLQYFHLLAFTRYSVDKHGHKLRQLTYGKGNIYRRMIKFEYCLSQPNFCCTRYTIVQYIGTIFKLTWRFIVVYAPTARGI